MGMTQEQKEKALELAAEGQSLRRLRGAIGVDARTFWEAVQEDPDYGRRFVTAQKISLEELADELVHIADDPDLDVMRARLKSDNAKWVLARKLPDTYGDRIDVNVTQVVDLRAALMEAAARAQLPISYPVDELPMRDAVLIEDRPPGSTDSQSAGPRESREDGEGEIPGEPDPVDLFG